MKNELTIAVASACLVVGNAEADEPSGLVVRSNMQLVVDAAGAARCDFDYAQARAVMTIRETPNSAGSVLTVQVFDAVPDTLYSVWIGATSPITGIPATPAASPELIDELLERTPPAPGTAGGDNAFRTNGQGMGKVSVALSFFLTDGVYPFPDGDVAIRTFPSYSVRLASHCSDGLLHGLLPGVHEPTFDGSL